MSSTSHEPKMIGLNTNDAEYKTVKKMFTETMTTDANIVAIKRVQNADLWEDFHR